MKSRRDLWDTYKMRLKRRRLLFRSWRKRRQLTAVKDRTERVRVDDIIAFVTVRNEVQRLPYFLEYYRKMGVSHFFFVENQSTDGTLSFLENQSDVSVWSTSESYRLSRFGVDWITALQMKYAHGHWCLTLDADELLVFPYDDTRPMIELINWLESQGQASFPAMMLDMYPKGNLASDEYVAGEDPIRTLNWFDAGNYVIQRKPILDALWIQGGVRARKFFADDPRRAPTLSKIPLVKWNRRYAYLNSTHSILPPRLNRVYGTEGNEMVSGILLHTKFLNMIVAKSEEEKQRKEHFENSDLYLDYYDSLMADPNLWCEHSTQYINWKQLEALGLMSRGAWL